MVLPREATPGHSVLAAVQRLKPLYEQGARELPTTPTIDLGRVWRAMLAGPDREQAFRAFEVATLLALRRALRNGIVVRQAMHWEKWVHLIASVYSGHTSAVSVMARFVSAARGDPWPGRVLETD